MTGDLPTPIKYYNRNISGAYKQLERSACEKLTEMLPAKLKSSISPYVLADEESVEYRLVKAADRLSAYIKCLEELRSGNSEFCEGQKEYRGRSAYPPYAGNRILFRKFHSLFFFDAGRTGRLLKRFFCFSLLKTRPTKREKGKACRKRAFAKIKKPNIHAFFKNS